MARSHCTPLPQRSRATPPLFSRRADAAPMLLSRRSRAASLRECRGDSERTPGIWRSSRLPRSSVIRWAGGDTEEAPRSRTAEAAGVGSDPSQPYPRTGRPRPQVNLGTFPVLSQYFLSTFPVLSQYFPSTPARPLELEIPAHARGTLAAWADALTPQRGPRLPIARPTGRPVYGLLNQTWGRPSPVWLLSTAGATSAPNQTGRSRPRPASESSRA